MKTVDCPLSLHRPLFILYMIKIYNTLRQPLFINDTIVPWTTHPVDPKHFLYTHWNIFSHTNNVHNFVTSNIQLSQRRNRDMLPQTIHGMDNIFQKCLYIASTLENGVLQKKFKVNLNQPLSSYVNVQSIVTTLKV